MPRYPSSIYGKSNNESSRYGRLPVRPVTATVRSHPGPLEILLFMTVLVPIAIRPLVDLFGNYTGQSATPGGILAIAIGLSAFLIFLIYTGAGFVPASGMLYLACFGLLFVVHIFLNMFVTWENVGVPGEIVGPRDVGYRLIASFMPLPVVFLVPRLDIDRRQIARFYWLFCLACLLPYVIALLQFSGHYPFSYFDWIDGQMVGRPSGGYEQPNSFSRLMVFIILFTMMFYGVSRHKLILRAILFMAMTGALLSSHRTSIICAGAIILIVILGDRRTARLFFDRLAAAIWVFGLFAFIYFVYADSDLGSEYIGKALSFSDVDFQFTSSGFLRGRGERFIIAFEYWIRDLGTIFMGYSFEPVEAHNDYLRILLVHGVFGFVIVFVMITAVMINTLNNVSRTGKAYVWASLVYLLIFAVSLHPTAYSHFMTLWALALVSAKVLYPRIPPSPAADVPYVRYDRGHEKR